MLVPAVLLIWLGWAQWETLQGWFGAGVEPAGESRPAIPADSTGDDATGATSGSPEARRWSELLGVDPVWPVDLASPTDCEAVEAEMIRLCTALEATASWKGLTASGGSCALIREVSETLVSRPPVISSELRSYDAILSNVFHLFRVLGAERVEALAGLAGSEPELAEPAAMALYRWLVTREECARSGTTTIRLPALYDYAGFLFQSIGGQAYLRRRTPRTEALVSFYALLVLDRAAEGDHNPDGVDPRPEILRTRQLIESQPLVFRDGYLNVLDAMEARWKEP